MVFRKLQVVTGVACSAAWDGLYFALADGRMVALKLRFARRGPAALRLC